MSDPLHGKCLCGGVEFTLSGDYEVAVCHCSMCRRFHGGPLLAVDVHEAPEFLNVSGLTWYVSSEWAERGFCSTCGASLFYRLKVSDPPHYAVAAGCLENLPDDTTLKEHIFIDEKPGYYEFADTCPRLTGAEAFARVEAQQS